MADKPKKDPTAIDAERAEQARVQAVVDACERERIRNIKIVTGKA